MPSFAAVGLGGTGGTLGTTDGRWANGVLGGAWRKDSAGYIGEGAREAARRARIARLSEELQQERTAIGELDAALDDVDVRRERLADEHRTVPPDAAVREAHTVAAAERRRRGELREQHAHAVTVCGQRQEELTRRRPAGRRVRPRRRPAGRAWRARRGQGRGGRRTGWRSPGYGRPPRRRRRRPGPRRRLRRSWPKAGRAWTRRLKPRPRHGARRRPLRRCYEALLETAGAAVDELYRQLEGRPARPGTSAAPPRKRRACRGAAGARRSGQGGGETGDASRRRSRRRRGYGTPPSRSSSRSPPPGCCASRCLRWTFPTSCSRGRRHQPCCWPAP